MIANRFLGTTQVQIVSLGITNIVRLNHKNFILLTSQPNLAFKPMPIANSAPAVSMSKVVFGTSNKSEHRASP